LTLKIPSRTDQTNPFNFSNNKFVLRHQKFSNNKLVEDLNFANERSLLAGLKKIRRDLLWQALFNGLREFFPLEAKSYCHKKILELSKYFVWLLEKFVVFPSTWNEGVHSEYTALRKPRKLMKEKILEKK